MQQIELLTKALRPLPDKFHGLTDQEQRFRQRYLDFLVNAEPRRVFEIRAKVVKCLRDFFTEHGFVEVETPMLHPLITGAAALPFETHHNAMDMDLYLRIAPELYLKRLVVGGFEKVYEINRNFRNEGISTRHNPEFTMMEFYQAYADYHDLMNFTEKMFRYLGEHVLKGQPLVYKETTIDLSQPFARMTMVEAICHYAPEITAEQLTDEARAHEIARAKGIKVEPHFGLGKIHMELFEEVAEKHLKQPTFITEFPAEVSPLARANDDNPFVTDRFELYVGGQEIANGFF